jgi:hypothetical protein
MLPSTAFRSQIHKARGSTFMMPSRRDPFRRWLAVRCYSRAAPRRSDDSQRRGVRFETFSFHDLPPAGDPQLIPTIVKNLQRLGIAECEIMSGLTSSRLPV